MTTADYRRDYERYDDRTLPIPDLVRIWQGLGEGKRLLFTLSLREDLADKVIEATCTRPGALRRDTE